MTVAELIQILQSYPHDLQVIYSKFSESVLLEPKDIVYASAQPPRDDGWVHDARRDRPMQNYISLC